LGVKVRLHIDHLIVDGITGLDRRALGRAVERELARRLGDQRLSAPEAGAHARVDAGPMALSERPTSAGVGADIGCAVHGAIAEPMRGGHKR